MKKITTEPEGNLYHWTGFLAHEFESSSYDGQPTGKIKRAVDDILQHGLKPFYDPLNTDGWSTISLTEDPLYAILYALCYAETWTSHLYIKNRWKVWYKILRGITASILKARLLGVERNEKTPTVFQKHSILDKAHRWTHTFNISNYNSPIHAFRAMIWGESDIPGNYPVVISTPKAGNMNAVPGWGEIRTTERIFSERISAIFVPEKYILELQKKTSIPVQSLEELIIKSQRGS